MKSILPLSVDSLCLKCDIEKFTFETSADLEDLNRFVGQERAVEAIELGTELELKGFNLFILGNEGTGRHTYIKRYLLDKASTRKTPSDWCYVNNFDEPHKPKTIELPAGKGQHFREQIERLIDEAQSAISKAFESEDYHDRRQAIEKNATEEQDNSFNEIQKHAEESGFKIIEDVTGFNFVPLVEDKLITPEQYQKLSQKEQEKLQKETEKLEMELRKMLRLTPRRERKVHEKISELDSEVTVFAMSDLIEELVDEYISYEKIVSFLKELQEDIIANVDLFKHGHTRIIRETAINEDLDNIDDQESSISLRYAVNLLVDSKGMVGAPVIFEDHPTYPYLVGQIEHISIMGTLTTDFTLIRSGALHRANGGYLIIDARKILEQPFSWDALKRALNAQKIDIKSLAQTYSLVSTVSLEPEPIPLDIKIVLIGDQSVYYLLQAYDPEFLELFKVVADFEDDMERKEDNIMQLARLIATIARQENLKPLDKTGIMRIIEESSRIAGNTERLSTRVRRLADIVREAHYWADKQARDVISAEEVSRAIEARRYRKSRMHDQIMREILHNTIMIATEGEVVGQVNGLAIIQLGDYFFGHPTRITARLSIGSGKVIDIEREVELGGPIHSKGVLILSNYLASHYAPDHPLSLSASLVFEQSYGPVEGDSASAAELCALLSALAHAPINQSIAITGSVNQYGHTQAIGGVNQKIEGFFDLCHARGLTGTQGVVIPITNVQHLMLRQRVIDAVADGQFHIYAKSSIDECMEILTGVEAGSRNDKGNFPKDSLNERIKTQLIEFAHIRMEYSSKGN
ncbi:MAG: lon-related putative ATP-dependent protease [Enterobacterales bacterium]|jgi:lon-related putative ATP-dependent protease